MRLKDLTVIVAAFIAFVYLFNPGAGFIEFIPDNFPVIGNLDEAAAVAIIVSAFKYFGINFPDIFKSEERASSKATKKEFKNATITASKNVLTVYAMSSALYLA